MQPGTAQRTCLCFVPDIQESLQRAAQSGTVASDLDHLIRGARLSTTMVQNLISSDYTLRQNWTTESCMMSETPSRFQISSSSISLFFNAEWQSVLLQHCRPHPEWRVDPMNRGCDASTHVGLLRLCSVSVAYGLELCINVNRALFHSVII